MEDWAGAALDFSDEQEARGAHNTLGRLAMILGPNKEGASTFDAILSFYNARPGEEGEGKDEEGNDEA